MFSENFGHFKRKGSSSNHYLFRGCEKVSGGKFFTPKTLGEMIQIDENIFQQGGWVALKKHLDEMWLVDGKDLDPKNL